MSKLPLTKLPLIFHFLKETPIEPNKADTKDENTIVVPFYQTPFYENYVFYKPISKIWNLKNDTTDQ
jgi:hypothetical protein